MLRQGLVSSEFDSFLSVLACENTVTAGTYQINFHSKLNKWLLNVLSGTTTDLETSSENHAMEHVSSTSER